MAFRYWSGLKVISLIHPIYFSMGLFALLNRYYLRYTGVVFIDYYINDLLSVPVTLYLTSLLLGFIYGKVPYPLNALKIGLAIVLFSITFEFIMPEYNSAYTFDFFDIMAYLAGGIIYFLISEYKN